MPLSPTEAEGPPRDARWLVLWDIDGTLVSNNDSDEALFVQAVSNLLSAPDPFIHPDRHGKTDLQQLSEYLLGNGGTTGQLRVASEQLVRVSRAHFTAPGERVALPGVVAILQWLRDAGHVNALLTGNGWTRAELKLMSAGLARDLFDWESSFFGDQVAHRPDLAIAAAARAATQGFRPVLVGDTVADANAADAAGIDFIGVATGVYTVEQLREAPHALLVENLSVGRAAVLDYLGGRATAA